MRVNAILVRENRIHCLTALRAEFRMTVDIVSGSGPQLAGCVGLKIGLRLVFYTKFKTNFGLKSHNSSTNYTILLK